MYSRLDGEYFDAPGDELIEAFHERMKRDSAPFRYLLDYETRKRLHYAERRRQREDEVVAVLLRVGQTGAGVEERGEAERLVAEHHLADRLPALRSLAKSRGVDLETVLRAYLRGDLAAVVALPRQEGE